MYWKEMGRIDEIIFGGRYAHGGRVDDPALVLGVFAHRALGPVGSGLVPIWNWASPVLMF
jgi:hypothetical protein